MTLAQSGLRDKTVGVAGQNDMLLGASCFSPTTGTSTEDLLTTSIISGHSTAAFADADMICNELDEPIDIDRARKQMLGNGTENETAAGNHFRAKAIVAQ